MDAILPSPRRGQLVIPPLQSATGLEAGRSPGSQFEPMVCASQPQGQGDPLCPRPDRAAGYPREPTVS